MGNQETRGMHFVPETYLNKFGVFDNKKDCSVFFLDKTEGNEIKATPPSNICKKRDMYLMEGETVEERQYVEDFYQNIETKYNQIYKTLSDDSLNEISQEEHEMVILFVITLLFRTHKLMSQYNNILKESFTKGQSVANQYVQDHFIYGDEIISFQDKTVNQVIKETAKSHNPNRVATQLKVALKLFQYRRDNSIIIFKIEDNNFSYLTSDNPVSIYHPENKLSSLSDFDNELALNIDSCHRIVVYPKSFISSPYYMARIFCSGEMARNETISSNYEQYLNADKFLISNEKKVIEEVVNYIEKINQIK
jgi:hypothetical protein